MNEHIKSRKISLSLLSKFSFSQGLYDGNVNSPVKLRSPSITTTYYEKLNYFFYLKNKFYLVLPSSPAEVFFAL